MAAAPFQSTLWTKTFRSFAASLRAVVAFSRASPACSRSDGVALSSKSSIALSRWPSNDDLPKRLRSCAPDGKTSFTNSAKFVNAYTPWMYSSSSACCFS
ncbi:hypothetical protein DBP18_15170 [Streptomyces sp. CS081A]|nr:hypothetical protein DBP18_15170 [Streptomyces sp. CS081A]